MALLTRKVTLLKSKHFSKMVLWVSDEGKCATCGTTEGPFLVAAGPAEIDENALQQTSRELKLPVEDLRKMVEGENVGCFACTVDALVDTGIHTGVQMGAAKVLTEVLGGLTGGPGGGMPRGVPVAQAATSDEYVPGGYL